MHSVNNQEFNVKSNVNFAPVLENWQMNCLKNFGNTIISKKHIDEKLSIVYYYIYGTKIRYNVLNKEAYLEKYNECFEVLRSHLEFLLNKNVSFRFSLLYMGGMLIVISLKLNKIQEVY